MGGGRVKAKANQRSAVPNSCMSAPRYTSPYAGAEVSSVTAVSEDGCCSGCDSTPLHSASALMRISHATNALNEHDHGFGSLHRTAERERERERRKEGRKEGGGGEEDRRVEMNKLCS